MENAFLQGFDSIPLVFIVPLIVLVIITMYLARKVFHRTMATLIVDMCHRIRGDTGLETVALSGGCFQNRLLFGQTVAGLRESGFRVLVHHQVPTNDGGLSLGQAVIANAQCNDRV